MGTDQPLTGHVEPMTTRDDDGAVTIAPAVASSLRSWAGQLNRRNGRQPEDGPYRGQVVRIPAGDFRWDGSRWAQIVQG